MKTVILLLLVLAVAGRVHAQIPVTDLANLASNQLSQAENIAKWIESIAQLKQQITQLDQQIKLQSDIRQWTGDPKAAGGKLVLDSLGASELTRNYGRAQNVIRSVTNSLDSLSQTGNGNYRAIVSVDLDGNSLNRDALAYRRYSILEATQANADQVTADTKARESELQEEIALTLEELKAAATEAETQKISAKLAALNGQLAQVEARRRREVDAVALQKMANDSRREEERLAAAESAAKDDYLANKRVSTYMNTLRVRKSATQ